MTTFALVHGSWHDGGCWHAVAGELEARGHSTVAPDLPCDDPVADCQDYAAVVMDALADAGNDVVVVGHSLGGLTAAVVAAERPVRQLVYLCALVPRPGRRVFDIEDGEPPIYAPGFGGAPERDELDRSRWPVAAAVEELYDDVPAALAREAGERLRPQARSATATPCPLAELPTVETISIVARDDAVISPEWSRWTARRRLDIEPVEIDGGHFPMFTRPAELAELLYRCGTSS